MDFCKLLHTAQKNDKNEANGARYYSTKFEPPKKLTKKKATTSKELSANVKKFLEKKEAEERQKAEDAQKKKEELLALRSQDKKAVKRVSIMLKSTKSANKSAIEDAVDNTHTALTMAGPDQPDEDDYGYVSQEASDLYSKMMEKYKSMPEEPKFKKFEKKVSTNLASTKDRVKAALEREKEEAMHPHKRKRKRKEIAEDEGTKDSEEKKDIIEEKQPEAQFVKPKPKPCRPAPPPMSFSDLLKIAEKKQHEPIIIEQKPKEDEKLLTKKQRRLAEQEREYKERKEAREREGKSGGEKSKLEARLTENSKTPKTIYSEVKQSSSANFKKPTDYQQKNPSHSSTSTNKYPSSNSAQSSVGTSKHPANGSLRNLSIDHSREVLKSKTPISGSNSRDIDRRIISSSSTNRSEKGSKPPPPSRPGATQRPPGSQLGTYSNAPKPSSGQMKAKEGGELKKRPLDNQRPVERRPDGQKPVQKTMEGLKKRPLPINPYMDMSDRFPMKKKPPPPKKRILDYDDEDEYDSELDDFIDDGPEEDGGGYSSVIKEIFGYDKSRYRDLDDDVDDMETPFAQQMKEEVRSAKIGIMEDLEDIEKEKEEKRRKTLMKKKMMKR